MLSLNRSASTLVTKQDSRAAATRPHPGGWAARITARLPPASRGLLGPGLRTLWFPALHPSFPHAPFPRGPSVAAQEASHRLAAREVVHGIVEPRGRCGQRLEAGPNTELAHVRQAGCHRAHHRVHALTDRAGGGGLRLLNPVCHRQQLLVDRVNAAAQRAAHAEPGSSRTHCARHGRNQRLLRRTQRLLGRHAHPVHLSANLASQIGRGRAQPVGCRLQAVRHRSLELRHRRVGCVECRTGSKCRVRGGG
mmetsp:Transcript_30396/g.98180  ORF Transcript_30396/g.98180 Transcript_30396/m.98180 type:complete len:251 (-) Transcript_30396:151-903(-)